MRFKKTRCCTWVHNNPMKLGFGANKLENCLGIKDLGMMFDSQLNTSQSGPRQWRPLAPWLGSALVWPEEEVSDHPSVIDTWLLLKSCVWFWAPHDKKDIDVLEHIQKRTIELVNTSPVKERLKKLGSFSLEKRRVRRDLITLYNYLKGGCSQAGLGHLSQAASDWTRGSGLKLHEGRFRWDIRGKKLFTERVVKYWISLTREIEPLSPKGFKIV